MHTGHEFFFCFLRRGALMITSNAGRDIRIKRLSFEAGAVTIDGLFLLPGGAYFCQYLRIPVNHSGVIHHFSQSDDSFTFHQRLKIFRRQSGAGGFHIGSGHTRGQSEINVDRLLFSRLQHIFNAG